jgi:hypothetical protein
MTPEAGLDADNAELVNTLFGDSRQSQLLFKRSATYTTIAITATNAELMASVASPALMDGLSEVKNCLTTGNAVKPTHAIITLREVRRKWVNSQTA